MLAGLGRGQWKASQARMNAAAEALNHSGERKYKVRYSVGEAFFDPTSDETPEVFGGPSGRKDVCEQACKEDREHVSDGVSGFPLSALPE